MPVLSIENLSFTYAGTTRPAMDDVSLEIQAGTVTAVAGANGAGKSTLCYALGGFIPHFFKGEFKGRVQVQGQDTQQTSLADLVTRVGLVFQNPFNQISGAKLSVLEEVAFGLENLGVPRGEMEQRVRAAVHLFGLDSVAEQSPYALSGGQQQRLALASIYVMQPPVMVLDEPTAQLDPQGTAEVMQTVRALAEQGSTIVLVEHKLEWIAELASRVLVLHQGKLAADGVPGEILWRAAEWGLVETRYARAARAAQARNLLPKTTALPQTLQQAIMTFG